MAVTAFPRSASTPDMLCGPFCPGGLAASGSEERWAFRERTNTEASGLRLTSCPVVFHSRRRAQLTACPALKDVKETQGHLLELGLVPAGSSGLGSLLWVTPVETLVEPVCTVSPVTGGVLQASRAGKRGPRVLNGPSEESWLSPVPLVLLACAQGSVDPPSPPSGGMGVETAFCGLAALPGEMVGAGGLPDAASASGGAQPSFRPRGLASPPPGRQQQVGHPPAGLAELVPVCTPDP